MSNIQTTAPSRRQRVQAAETCLIVLKALARLGGRASLTAIANAVGESTAKVHRYLASLIAQDLVKQDRSNAQYVLSHETMRLGLTAMRQSDPIRGSEEVLADLCETMQVTSFIAVMGNLGPTIVRMEEPGLPVTMNVRVGSVMSLLWSATGRAFFAFMDEDAHLRARLAHELETAPAEKRALLDATDPLGVLRRNIRAAGCAWVRDTNLAGISAVAAPLYDYRHRVAAVLCALGASGGFNPAPDAEIARAVCNAAAQVSMALGYDAGGDGSRLPPAS